MKTKILQYLSFLAVTFYNFSALASGTALADLEKLLIANKTEQAFKDYLYFDGVRLWIILAAAIIAVNVVNLASDIGKDLGGTPLGGSVSNTAIKLGTGAAAFAAKAAPVVGEKLKKTLKKSGNDLAKDSSGASGKQSTPSAGTNNFESPQIQEKPEKPEKPASSSGITANAQQTQTSASSTSAPTDIGSGTQGATSGGESSAAGTASGVVAAGTALAGAGINALKENASNMLNKARQNIGAVSAGVNSMPSADIDVGEDSTPTDTKPKNTKKAEMPGRGSGVSLPSSDKKDVQRIAEEKANRVKEALRAEYTERIGQESSRLAGGISAVSGSINSAINDKVAPVVSVSNEASSVAHQAMNREIPVHSVEVSQVSKPEDMSKRLETSKK